MNKEELITVILLWTRFSEEYLRGLSKKELEKIYQERVERG
ncbi:BH0509 family protein [Robertmurraya sp. DFI.2.37]|nr:BH0509 family protein [Robertmurraya sp. DFI.2.37]MDF1507637.1 BH0509 family protein [Robertmurraya sp. DFI.2.37]